MPYRPYLGVLMLHMHEEFVERGAGLAGVMRASVFEWLVLEVFYYLCKITSYVAILLLF